MTHDRAEKRKNDYKHAVRKREIVRNWHFGELYDNLHQYSKNKIHCSCALCREKSKDDYSIADKRKKQSMKEQEDDTI